MKNITAILLIVTAIGLFSYYIDPTYKQVKQLRAQEADFAEALENTSKVQDFLAELQTKYNSFSEADHVRIERLLPDSVDNVRLIIEIDKIASRHNMVFADVQTSDTRSRTAPSQIAGAIGEEGARPYASAPLSFTVTGSYGGFLNFLQDIEKSLRVMDITDIGIKPGKDSDEYDFDIKLRTYWLKPTAPTLEDPGQYAQ